MKVLLSLLFLILFVPLFLVNQSYADTHIEELLEQGKKNFEKGDYWGANSYFDQALKIDPDNYRANSGYAATLIEVGKYHDAIVLLEELHKINDQDLVVLNNLITASYLTEDLEKMFFYNDKSLAINPDDIEVLINNASVVHAKKDYKIAIEQFSLLIQDHPDDIEILNNRGVSYCWEGEYVNGIFDLKKSLAVHDDNTNAYNNLGICYALQNKLITALEYFEESERITPEKVSTLRNLGKIHSELGVIYDDIEEFKKSIKYYDQVLEFKENDPQSKTGKLFAQNKINAIELVSYWFPLVLAVVLSLISIFVSIFLPRIRNHDNLSQDESTLDEHEKKDLKKKYQKFKKLTYRLTIIFLSIAAIAAIVTVLLPEFIADIVTEYYIALFSGLAVAMFVLNVTSDHNYSSMLKLLNTEEKIDKIHDMVNRKTNQYYKKNIKNKSDHL